MIFKLKPHQELRVTQLAEKLIEIEIISVKPKIIEEIKEKGLIFNLPPSLNSSGDMNVGQTIK